jgi:DNA-binding NarL/FixJ family response regulator
MAGTPIRVLVVDDQEVIRGLVVLACERDPGLVLAGEAATGMEALESVRSTRPDVLVLDLTLPDMDGIEVARRVRAEGSVVRIMILTGRNDRRTLFEARTAGADAFVEKTGAIGRVGELIHAVARGAALFSPDQERAALRELQGRVTLAREASRAAGVLTEREMTTLRLLAEGLTTRQAARRMGLSERTVETHIGKVHRKLGVRSRVEAVTTARALGLLDPPTA